MTNQDTFTTVTLHVDELKPGDIMLFKGDENEWISAAIMFLTNSDVSHAALYYNEQQRNLVDEVLKGIGVHEVSDAAPDTSEAHFIYVRRFKGPDGSAMPMGPVIDAATKYITAGEPYDKASLLLLALILLYKDFTPATWVQKVMIKIFQRAVSLIDELINDILHPGKHPMVCSQFVFQCYEDSPLQYHLESDEFAITRSMATPSIISASGAPKRFIDLVQEHLASGRSVAGSYPALSAVISESDEELAKQLVDAMRIDAGGRVEAVPFALDETLVQSTKQLADAIVKFYSLPSDSVNDSVSVLAFNKALFVTPEDLKSGFRNQLGDTGTAWINRK
jgi:hypothetical protein